MTRSGKLFLELETAHNEVLIPLLVDDPLWDATMAKKN